LSDFEFSAKIFLSSNIVEHTLSHICLSVIVNQPLIQLIVLTKLTYCFISFSESFSISLMSSVNAILLSCLKLQHTDSLSFSLPDWITEADKNIDVTTINSIHSTLLLFCNIQKCSIADPVKF